MTVSVVLRLVADPQRRGELKGLATAVATGEDRVVRSVGELIDFLVGLVDPLAVEAKEGAGNAES